MPLIHTPEETAEIIGGDMTASWLREQCRQRKIPFTFLAGKYGFTDTHIAAIVKAAEQAPRPAKTGRTASRTHAQPRPPAAAAGEATVTPLLRARSPRPRERAS